jgi:hypothetical protein
MQGVIIGLLAMGLTATASVAQQPMSQNERAYTITLICNAIAANDNDHAGSARSIDAARRMATALGYSTERLSSDLITMASVVGVQLRDEPAKVEHSRAVCRQFGLLS